MKERTGSRLELRSRQRFAHSPNQSYRTLTEFIVNLSYDMIGTKDHHIFTNIISSFDRLL